MAESPLEEDQEIAENIQNRVFYEETTLDLVVKIVRDYKNQGFSYLDAATQLFHVHIRMLEQYSKQNIDMQVRSRRRARQKKKATRVTDENDDDDEGSDAEDLEASARTSSERKFDFSRYQARFAVQACVDTFVAFANYYKDLDPEQLKRAVRFFYRIAFKLEQSVLLFRVDIINLFVKMMQGTAAMDRSNKMWKEWDDFVRHLIRLMMKKIEERPELIVEMLFSKVGSTTHFLQYGYDKPGDVRRPKAGAEFEVKPGISLDQHIGVAVSALVDGNKGDAVEWVKNQLLKAIAERKSWEEEAEFRRAERVANTNVENGEGEPAEVEEPKPSSISESRC